MSEFEPTTAAASPSPRGAPTLEELGAEWLRASSSFSVGAGSGPSPEALELAEDLDDEGDEREFGEVIYEAPTSASQQIRALEDARLRQAEAIARSGILQTQETALDTLTTAPAAIRPRFRRRPLVLVAVAALAVGGAAAWRLSISPDEDRPTAVSVAPGPAAAHAAKSPTTPAPGALPQTRPASPLATVSAPTLVDRKGERMELESLTVSTPLPGQRCDEPVAALSLARTRKAALCLKIDRPVRGRVTVAWTKDGETKRRSLIDAPAAQSFSARALLALDEDDVGTWTARVTANDAELGAIEFIVAP